MPEKKLGLALSGGGTRGIAHLGVLKALEEEGIRPDEVAGTSAGAIAGALYAAGYSTGQMMDFARESSLLKIFKVTFPLGGLTKLTYLRNRLREMIPHDSFEGLELPLHVVASDLVKGRAEIFSRGPLSRVIEASCSVPLVFQPVTIDGRDYVDGGLLENLPSRALADRTSVVVGVNVMPMVELSSRSSKGFINIATRIFDLSVHANTLPSLERCDVVVEPTEVHKYNIFQFSRQQELFDLGYEATRQKMGDILAALQPLM